MISTASRRRFSGLSDAIASPNARIKAIRAVTALMYDEDDGDLPHAIVTVPAKPAAKTSPAPTPANRPTPVAAIARPAAPKPRAAMTIAEMAKDVKVPDDVKAKGAVYATTWAEAFVRENLRVASQLRRLQDHPAAVGRAGALLELVAAGQSDEEIRAKLPYQASDKQRRVDGIWERAIKSVCGGTRTPRASASAADTVWDRAYAKINSECGR